MSGTTTPSSRSGASATLRHIALTVEQIEGKGGRAAYGWLLIESAGGSVFVLKRGTRSYTSYLDALEAGYQELALLSACGLHARPPHDTGEDAFTGGGALPHVAKMAPSAGVHYAL